MEALGWKVVVLWECEIKQDFENLLSKLDDLLKNDWEYTLSAKDVKKCF